VRASKLSLIVGFFSTERPAAVGYHVSILFCFLLSLTSFFLSFYSFVLPFPLFFFGATAPFYYFVFLKLSINFPSSRLLLISIFSIFSNIP